MSASRWTLPPLPWSLRRSPVAQQILQQASAVMEHGELVWAVPFRIRQRKRAQLAGVLYGTDAYVRIRPGLLRAIGHELRAYLDEFAPGSDEVWMRHVEQQATVGAPVLHQPLPPTLSGDYRIYQSTVILWPDQLPVPIQHLKELPLLLGPKGVALVLPADRWPER